MTQKEICAQANGANPRPGLVQTNPYNRPNRQKEPLDWHDGANKLYGCFNFFNRLRIFQI